MGFDVDKFVSKVSEERKCSLCHLVLDNPVKTACCHVFCSGCILPWVVRHGKCPHNCQSLTPKDLENILPLRETILNMHVRCNFLDRGCQAVVRLTDVEAHVQDCTFRPVQCPNRGCEEIVSYKDVSKHENTECSFRKIGVCKKGCDLELYLNTVENHDCLTALNDQIKWKESKIYTLETEMKRLVSKFDKREKSLLVQLTNLRNELKSQAEYFQNKLCDYSHKIGLVKTDNEREDQVNLTIVLRKENNTLGFNIMGGYTPENNNNNEEKKEMDTSSSSEDSIIVSRLTDNGPAEKSGLLLEDRIIKVNGTDLSQSSHEEAVEAFRTAKEPIVVEVLRRVNKTKMKNRSPTMVSIGTQTEEDIYGYNRPPTPPPAIYPFHSSGLYQPSSRRPVAFSPSADMGLTDIEMAHALEYDDAYFEERAYDVEYEEVVLHRSSTNEKLGLTLCYGSLEDEMTDIFISEVDPCSIAAQDGRIREGDQILQINGIDVHSRDQAIKLFSEQSSNITLLLARPQLQLDDGFMEDQNVVLDDLHMDILEKHHHDNMQIMASMLARGHIDEEGGTTDTATTENSLHKHEKDSGVGRTDESTKNDESSEQETLDTECTNSPAATTKFRQCYNLNKHEQIYSDESFLSHDCTHDVIVNDIPSEECDKFREVLARRFSNGIENSPRNDSVRKDSRGSIEHELALLNKEMEQIQLECEEIVQSHLCEQNISQKRENTPYKSPRIVPRMGTRLEYLKHVQSYDSSEKDVLSKQGQSSSQLEKDKDATSTSAYNTGESCRSTPLTLELNPASDEGEKGFKNSMLCLAPTASTMTPSLSDTEKQTQTPCSRSKDGSSDDNLLETSPGSLKDQGGMGESLQDLYVRYADVMYTNHANLQHTIAIQQKLFQQQLEQKPRYAGSPQPGSASSRSTVHQPDDFHAQGSPNMTPPDSSSQMEWVVKRRPDGTRYITRRPVRSKMLKERAKKISEERCGMTTDDDAMSELKTGRYWSKEDRKRHLEKAKDQKRRRELMMKAKMETLKETEEKKEVNIVELSHRKMNKRKGKKVLDNFVTVQEMMAHGSRVQDGKTYNPLLSVTTV